MSEEICKCKCGHEDLLHKEFKPRNPNLPKVRGCVVGGLPVDCPCEEFQPKGGEEL